MLFITNLAKWQGTTNALGLQFITIYVPDIQESHECLSLLHPPPPPHSRALDLLQQLPVPAPGQRVGDNPLPQLSNGAAEGTSIPATKGLGTASNVDAAVSASSCVAALQQPQQHQPQQQHYWLKFWLRCMPLPGEAQVRWHVCVLEGGKGGGEERAEEEEGGGPLCLLGAWTLIKTCFPSQGSAGGKDTRCSPSRGEGRRGRWDSEPHAPLDD